MLISLSFPPDAIGFEGYTDKHQYSIVGHSGESSEILLVDYNKPPRNVKERMDVLDQLHAHSQYCLSGDNTLQAASRAVQEVTRKDAGNYFVFLVSDANLRRYRINPRELHDHLVSRNDRSVNAYAIFLASFGNEANSIVSALPPGRGHVCMDTSLLPGIFKSIFISQFDRNN